ncbi:bZIP transcription factor [Aspergillus lucknowensis]|uniref:BZIP domain-containing protein n=1 Tax=Aspergillus lucknowensis TaxID=176173 RepID=A0ABR4M4V6_9EURO
MADNLSQTLSARCFLPGQQGRVTQSLHPPKDPPPDGAKKRGRPLMAPNGDPARMDRRAQIRYAQRTYRHKKELMYRSMEHRVAELESSLNRVSGSLSDFFEMAIDSDLHVTHPQLFQHLRETVTQLKQATGATEKEETPREIVSPVLFGPNVSPEDTSSFGYVVNCLQDASGGAREDSRRPFRVDNTVHPPSDVERTPPFYCVGGAGTRYPRLEDGKPVCSEKMRLSRRVLRTLANSSSEDISSVDRQKLLEMAELDGTWLDTQDVLGYLQEKGVLNDTLRPPSETVSCSLDIEGFFQGIVGNMVILGRSPGFRLRDVKAALAASLRVDSK